MPLGKTSVGLRPIGYKHHYLILAALEQHPVLKVALPSLSNFRNEVPLLLWQGAAIKRERGVVIELGVQVKALSGFIPSEWAA